MGTATANVEYTWDGDDDLTLEEDRSSSKTWLLRASNGNVSRASTMATNRVIHQSCVDDGDEAEPPVMVCDPFWEIEGATDLDVTETVEE